MTGSYGWTSWGWADAGELGTFRVWKHHTEPLIAVHTDHEGDPTLLLSHLNETLEDEAGVEHAPTPAEKDQERQREEERQTLQDIKVTALRLEAENAELRRRLGGTQGVDPATLRVVHADDGSACGQPVVYVGTEGPLCDAHRRAIRQVPLSEAPNLA